MNSNDEGKRRGESLSVARLLAFVVLLVLVALVYSSAPESESSAPESEKPGAYGATEEMQFILQVVNGALNGTQWSSEPTASLSSDARCADSTHSYWHLTLASIDSPDLGLIADNLENTFFNSAYSFVDAPDGYRVTGESGIEALVAVASDGTVTLTIDSACFIESELDENL